ncbi:hypothetical protein [Enterovibrio norvegicus]|uniref:DUF304 domain-containing protein n=1 Tax=Enterovibrio norvegicus TaxID=188144 RepID=A0ABV4LAS2_9GAMM|nr:hypothetical protein [Enterovibrio norvegicus]OEF58628.1 hypothetical protein A1OU_10735 [Enterovibrio norvegicus]
MSSNELEVTPLKSSLFYFDRKELAEAIIGIPISVFVSYLWSYGSSIMGVIIPLIAIPIILNRPYLRARFIRNNGKYIITKERIVYRKPNGSAFTLNTHGRTLKIKKRIRGYDVMFHKNNFLDGIGNFGDLRYIGSGIYNLSKCDCDLVIKYFND